MPLTSGKRKPALLAALVSTLVAAPAPAGQDPSACGQLEGRHGDLMVERATAIPAATGWTPETGGHYAATPVNVAFCRVEGMIEGNIGLELWLPHTTEWNGRLLGAGVGGPAGVFNYRDMSLRLNEGFAAFSTDSGHKASDARWMADPKALRDYNHRATHLSTVAAKKLLARHYGESQKHSYFLGCSGGGRQGMKEMQKYPEDFDGIVSGAPAPYMPLQSVRMMWSALLQKHNPDAALTGRDWALYETTVTQACDGNDGVRDGIIENPATCEFDTAVLECAEDETDSCLTAPKRAMLDRIVAPMPDEAGQPMDFGLFPGVRTRPGPPSPLLRAMWADGVYNDPDWDEDSFERTRDLEAVNAAMPELRADNTDIDGFLAANGKAIIYQGWSDPSTVAGLAIDYYRKLAARYNGVDRLDDNVRLLIVPGMYHCRGGPGADQFGGSGHQSWPGDDERDILWAMIRWVEQGIAPDRLIATKFEGDAVRFTRALCPFPRSARFEGGDSDDARAFSCAPDPALTSLLQQ